MKTNPDTAMLPLPIRQSIEAEVDRRKSTGPRFTVFQQRQSARQFNARARHIILEAKQRLVEGDEHAKEMLETSEQLCGCHEASYLTSEQLQTLIATNVGGGTVYTPEARRCSEVLGGHVRDTRTALNDFLPPEEPQNASLRAACGVGERIMFTSPVDVLAMAQRQVVALSEEHTFKRLTDGGMFPGVMIDRLKTGSELLMVELRNSAGLMTQDLRTVRDEALVRVETSADRILGLIGLIAGRDAREQLRAELPRSRSRARDEDTVPPDQVVQPDPVSENPAVPLDATVARRQGTDAHPVPAEKSVPSNGVEERATPDLIATPHNALTTVPASALVKSNGAMNGTSNGVEHG